MVALHDAIRQGQTSLERTIVLKEGDMVPGSGIITGNFSAGTQISLNDAMRLMMIHSDNTATNLVVDQIGLPATAALMEKMGIPTRNCTPKFIVETLPYSLNGAKSLVWVAPLQMKWLDYSRNCTRVSWSATMPARPCTP